MDIAVNYDQLAATYNQRFSGDSQSGVLSFLLELARRQQARRILEVGCGTGHWLEGLTQNLPAGIALYGLERSAGMLVQAKQAGLALLLLRGLAWDLPFPHASFDLVYAVNAIHHFDQQTAFVQAASHLLRPGGALAVIGMDPHGKRATWYVYEFFEGAYDTDLQRFPRWETLQSWMVSAGLGGFQRGTAHLIQDDMEGAAVFDHPFLAKNSCSQLALLSEAAYQAGLQRIRLAVAAAQERGEAFHFANQIHLEYLTGFKSV